MGKVSEISHYELNLANPVLEFADMYSQKITPTHLTIFRAYANGYHWLNHKYNDHESRNLGFYNPVQTDLANHFRSKVTEWLNDSKNYTTVIDNLVSHMDIKRSSKTPIGDFIIKLTKDSNVMTNSYVELYILSKINKKIPTVITNDENKILYIFN